MITNHELTAVELSPTKKDFYQIWNELLEIAGKLSERWDPSSTNESDPGIVLLKVLTAVADKLNYTIDANTLEAFMPSAAQEESMRKLCNMLGYDMKYLQSATTDVKISYNVSGHDIPPVGGVCIDKFTNIKDVDGTINYITLKEVYLDADTTSAVVSCIEGELIECESADDNIISILHLDDNKRYYLPETQVAENGIFITNINDGTLSEPWERVANLNTCNIKSKVFKFGYDSRESLPYIQFPEDISSIIEDGLKIKYVRTSGAAGNIAPNTLCKLSTPANWNALTSSNASAEDKDYYNTENYTVKNPSAATNGKDKEELNEAYENYKKTIGTFDTLVTCRDYMNKIYQMTIAETNNTPLVSNVIVSDIRDDINKAMTLCTFTDKGIEYKTMAKPIDLGDCINISRAEFENLNWNSTIFIDGKEYIFGATKLGQVYKVFTDAAQNTDTVAYYARIIFNGNTYESIKVNTTPINHFDLVLYPFTPVYGINSKAEYDSSFKYTDLNLVEIKQNLEENKTLAHTFIEPEKDDIACIKNYYRLSAKITTTRKVSSLEQLDILGRVYSKLYETFNLRKLEFGEEIPYNTILSVMESADSRIKYIKLEDPEIVTKFCTVSGAEFTASTKNDIQEDVNKVNAGDIYYNKLALNNIIAGKFPLFDYNESFIVDYTESPYPNPDYALTYGEEKAIKTMATEFQVSGNATELKLLDNEVIQFRCPSLITDKTYPAYVNYYARLNTSTTYNPRIPATMWTLKDFLEHNFKTTDVSVAASLIMSALYSNSTTLNGKEFDNKGIIFNEELIGTVENIEQLCILWKNKPYFGVHEVSVKGTEADAAVTIKKVTNIVQVEDSDKKVIGVKISIEGKNNPTDYTLDENISDKFKYLKFSTSSAADFGKWRNWLKSLPVSVLLSADELNGSHWEDSEKPLTDLYKLNITDYTKLTGKLVDSDHNVFKAITTWNTITSDPFFYYYLPRIWSTTDIEKATHTADGLGQNGSLEGIKKDTEYRLNENEFLLINYTNSSDNEGTEVKTVINEYYGPGQIIKPNFDLADSAEYAKDNHKYNKTEGFSFEKWGYTSKNIGGLFTLGTDQQIEIRKFNKVELDDTSTNIYWERADEVADDYGRVEFVFNEITKDASGNVTEESYTLKEGEWFYYTDRNKTDIAYYGNGTKITKSANTPKIYKSIKDNLISTEDIAASGLNAAIPWRPYDLSKSGNKEKKLIITENQYITLTKDDILKSIDMDANSLTNSWVPVNDATYKLGGSTGETSLPLIDFGGDLRWEGRSKLEIKMNQKEPQLLRTLTAKIYNKDTNETTNNLIAKDIIKIYEQDITTVRSDKNLTPIKTLEALDEFSSTADEDVKTKSIIMSECIPLAIKSNKALSVSSDLIDVTTKIVDAGIIVDSRADLLLKLLVLNEIRDSKDAQVNLNNFGEGNFTKVSFDNLIIDTVSKEVETKQETSESGESIEVSYDRYIYKNQKFTTLNALIPNGHYGLIMFYNKLDSNSSGSYLRFNFAENIDSITVSCEEDSTTWSIITLDGKTIETEVEILPEKLAALANGESLVPILSISDNNTLIIDGVDSHLNIYTIMEEKYITTIFNKDDWWLESDTQENPRVNPNSTGKVISRLEIKDNIIYRTSDYYLREGLNIIKVPASCEIEIWPGTIGNFSQLVKEGEKPTPPAVANDILIFGKLDIIKNNTINKKINYRVRGEETLDAILAEIKKLDPDYNFYYNNKASLDYIIDLNELDDTDTLDYVSTWYDYNNINNKFVISEIDTDYLTENVVIAKASRGNY